MMVKRNGRGGIQVRRRSGDSRAPSNNKMNKWLVLLVLVRYFTLPAAFAALLYFSLR